MVSTRHSSQTPSLNSVTAMLPPKAPFAARSPTRRAPSTRGKSTSTGEQTNLRRGRSAGNDTAAPSDAAPKFGSHTARRNNAYGSPANVAASGHKVAKTNNEARDAFAEAAMQPARRTAVQAGELPRDQPRAVPEEGAASNKTTSGSTQRPASTMDRQTGTASSSSSSRRSNSQRAASLGLAESVARGASLDSGSVRGGSFDTSPHFSPAPAPSPRTRSPLFWLWSLISMMFSFFGSVVSTVSSSAVQAASNSWRVAKRPRFWVPLLLVGSAYYGHPHRDKFVSLARLDWVSSLGSPHLDWAPLPLRPSGNASSPRQSVNGSPAAPALIDLSLMQKLVDSAVADRMRQYTRKMENDAAALFPAKTAMRPNLFAHGTGVKVDPYLTSPTRRITLGGKLWPTVQHWQDRIFSPHTYWYPSSLPTADHIFKGWDDFGEAWCSPKSDGKAQVGIALPEPVFPEELVVEHMPAAGLMDPSSMPQNLELWVQVKDAAQRAQVQSAALDDLYMLNDGISAAMPSSVSDDVGAKKALDDTWVRIGSFRYQRDGPAAQGFRIPVDMARLKVPIGRMAVRTTSSWGESEGVCMYRLKLHGSMGN